MTNWTQITSNLLSENFESVDAGNFGVEYLGWGKHDFNWIQGVFEEGDQPIDLKATYGITHLRWPGGIPAEDPFLGNAAGKGYDGTSLADFRMDQYSSGATESAIVPVMDLKDPNYVNWYFYDGGKAIEDYDASNERPGLQELVRAAEETGMDSLAIVLPTARYAARMFDLDESGDLASATTIRRIVADVAKDMSTFLSNLDRILTQEGSDLEITLEIGSEYYATKLWRYVTSDQASFDIDVPEVLDNLVWAFGLVFAAQTAVIADFEDTTGREIVTALQLGRTQSGDLELQGSGADNQVFIDAFDLLPGYWSTAATISPDYRDGSLGAMPAIDAIEAVDMGIWHRYISEWGFLDDHLTEDLSPGSDDIRPSVEEMMAQWSEAGAGTAYGDFLLLGGWGAPVVGAHDQLDSRLIPGKTVDLFARLIEAGMDQSSIYGWNSNKTGALTHADDVLIGGQIFELLAENTVGLFHVGDLSLTVALSPDASDRSADRNGDGWIDPGYDNGSVNGYHFADASSVVSYFVVGEVQGTTQSHTFLFEGLRITDFELTSLSIDLAIADQLAVYEVLPRGDVSDTLVGHSGVLSDLTSFNVKYTDAGTAITFSFSHDYELIQIVGLIAPEPFSGLVDLSDQPGHLGGVMVDFDGAAAGLTTGTEIIGNDFDNKLVGGNGNDTILGGGGVDELLGGLGDDFIFSGVRSMGEEGIERLDGGAGADVLRGGIGSDALFGGDDDDFLFGDPGSLLGGADILNGGRGNDRLSGGGGGDVFIFEKVGGFDVIGAFDIETGALIGQDFTVGLDRIDLTDFGFSDYGQVLEYMFEINGSARFSSVNMTFTVHDVSISELTADTFIL